MTSRSFMLPLAVAAALAMTAAAGTAAGPSTEWANKTVPVEVFAQFPMVDQPRITPDGKWIAAKIRARGEQVLAILPVGPAGKPEIIGRGADFASNKQGERRIIDYRWVDSDHLLIGIASRDDYAGQWFDNVRYVEQPLNTHNLLREPDRVEVLQQVTTFLHEHNPA
jgi:hypothetical protein